jgi:hypothetical protein
MNDGGGFTLVQYRDALSVETVSLNVDGKLHGNTAIVLSDFLALPETASEKFQRLKDEWENATVNISSFDQMIAHPAYVAIIKMGKPAIPLLLNELSTSPNHCFLLYEKSVGQIPSQRDRPATLKR